MNGRHAFIKQVTIIYVFFMVLEDKYKFSIMKIRNKVKRHNK
jgi:hypothetical protein